MPHSSTSATMNLTSRHKTCRILVCVVNVSLNGELIDDIATSRFTYGSFAFVASSWKEYERMARS